MVMKPISKLSFPVLRAFAALGVILALTSCELPPRETWRIVQRDGLITYWTHEYHPETLPTRYLPPSNGGPLVTRYMNTQVPYRTGALGSRYLAAPSRPYRVTYQPNYVTRGKVVTLHTAFTERPHKREVSPSHSERAPAVAPEVARETLSRIETTPPGRNPSPEPLPYGTAVPGRPGMVTSPFAEKQQLVDVTGMAVGETVKDPYSGKLFRVPPTAQAKAPAASPATEAPPPNAKKTP
jgi:hypothetical protein